MKVGVGMAKPIITEKQLIKSSVFSKSFGTFRKLAKKMPLYITENGNVDSVFVDYAYFEQMYERLTELEELEETLLLTERIERIDRDPSSTISWRDVRRSGK